MTTNIDRAASLIAEMDGDGKLGPVELAQALAAEGLLMPDLPEPTNWTQGHHPVWKSHGVRMTMTEDGKVKFSDGALPTWAGTPTAFRDIALTMLAAAACAEEHNDTEEEA